MYFFILILLLLVLVIVLLFVYPANVFVQLNASQNEFLLRLRWIQSLLTAKVLVNTDASVLSIYLFQTRIYTKPIRNKKNKKKHSAIGFLQSLSLQRIRADFFYGFFDPFYTGITCGLLPFFGQFFPKATLRQHPDFIPETEYLCINAGAEWNIGKTLYALTKRKIER